MKQLIIQQKTYDMILYGNICLKQFPKYEKHVMSAEIRRVMYKILSLIIRANKKYHKKTAMQDIDVELDVLRVYVRMAADPQLKYLDIKKYEHWSKQLNEIGRLLGGWMKSAKH